MFNENLVYLVGAALIVVGAVYIWVQHRKNVNNMQRSLLNDAKILEEGGFGFFSSLLYEACMLNAYQATRMIIEKLQSINTISDLMQQTRNLFYKQLDLRMADPEERRAIKNKIGRFLKGGDGEYELVAMPRNSNKPQS